MTGARAMLCITILIVLLLHVEGRPSKFHSLTLKSLKQEQEKYEKLKHGEQPYNSKLSQSPENTNLSKTPETPELSKDPKTAEISKQPENAKLSKYPQDVKLSKQPPNPKHPPENLAVNAVANVPANVPANVAANVPECVTCLCIMNNLLEAANIENKWVYQDNKACGEEACRWSYPIRLLVEKYERGSDSYTPAEFQDDIESELRGYICDNNDDIFIGLPTSFLG